MSQLICPESEAGPSQGENLPGALSDALRAELIAFRRDLHMHPELGNQEFRTTAAIKDRLERAGLAPRVLASGTGLICDVGTRGEDTRPMLALRADIDALPIPDTKAACAVPLHRARPRPRLRPRRPHRRCPRQPAWSSPSWTGRGGCPTRCG